MFFFIFCWPWPSTIVLQLGLSRYVFSKCQCQNILFVVLFLNTETAEGINTEGVKWKTTDDYYLPNVWVDLECLFWSICPQTPFQVESKMDAISAKRHILKSCVLLSGQDLSVIIIPMQTRKETLKKKMKGDFKFVRPFQLRNESDFVSLHLYFQHFQMSIIQLQMVV